ncbi:hypothetical protein E1B28_009079 [Marasmius oreades]|uniref:Uncharacterized protein n=1 Tax=Marasmius oreades TaxID=181124 RepID=A0A9P7S0B6_9AGAR|nr:uncharacterized protein E1B28_009079 [Marasmius oreades]KAG7092752.1 hypothetical protein E1B28_009079 [Marasmius oreades]
MACFGAEAHLRVDSRRRVLPEDAITAVVEFVVLKLRDGRSLREIEQNCTLFEYKEAELLNLHTQFPKLIGQVACQVGRPISPIGRAIHLPMDSYHCVVRYFAIYNPPHPEASEQDSCNTRQPEVGTSGRDVDSDGRKN